jgi:hypothetical protein
MFHQDAFHQVELLEGLQLGFLLLPFGLVGIGIGNISRY